MKTNVKRYRRVHEINDDVARASLGSKYLTNASYGQDYFLGRDDIDT